MIKYNLNPKFILILLLLLNLQIFSQTEESKNIEKKPKSKFRDRLTYTGNFGGWLGNPTSLNISPLIGYRATDKITVGLGPMYNYFGYNNSGLRTRQSVYGGRGYVQLNVNENIFCRWQSDYVWISNTVGTNKFKSNTDVHMIGGGYRQGMLTMAAFYIVNYDPIKTPYAVQDPLFPVVVQIGVVF